MTEPATEEKSVDPNEPVDIQFVHDKAPEGEKPATATVRRWQFEKVWEPKGWTVVKPSEASAADAAAAKAAGKHADTGTTTPSK